MENGLEGARVEAGGYYGHCPSGSWFWLRAEYGLIRDGRKGIHLGGRQRIKEEGRNVASLLGVHTLEWGPFLDFDPRVN